MNTAITTTANDSDCQLLEGLLRDDARAWRTFNERYSRLMFRCITRVTGRFASVVGQEDVQEIYANLCVQLLQNDKKKLRAYDAARGSKLSTWIGILATNAAWDYLRAAKRSPRFDDLQTADDIVSVCPDPLDICEHRERASQIAQVLASFPEKDREFVALYYGQGLAPEVVAEEMGISVKTVYSKKHKIRERLQGLLKRELLAA